MTSNLIQFTALKAQVIGKLVLRKKDTNNTSTHLNYLSPLNPVKCHPALGVIHSDSAMISYPNQREWNRTLPCLLVIDDEHQQKTPLHQGQPVKSKDTHANIHTTVG